MRMAAGIGVAGALLYALYSLAASDFSGRADVDAYIDQLSQQQGFNREDLTKLFKDAERKQNILDAIARPAEKTKPWSEYRDVFLTDRASPKASSSGAKMPPRSPRQSRNIRYRPEIVVAIIGVETRYGRNAGTYRVLDALSTLAFDYPPRSDFFRGELTEFLLLAREEGMDPRSLMGSYAGAMGYGQFIPSSFRNYAVDFDGDGKRNIWTNPQGRNRQRRKLFPQARLDRGRTRRRTGVDHHVAGRCDLEREPEPAVHRWTVARARRDGERATGRGRGRLIPNGWQRRSRVLGRLAQLLRHHPVQPQQHVRARGSPARTSHRGPRIGSRPGRTPCGDGQPMTFGRACRLALLAAVVALVVGCSTTPSTPTADSGPIGTPDLSNLPDPIPHAEPPSKYGNKSPYEVLGKTYYVLPNPDNYKEYGKASWYGTKFHGQRTSSGELYDMYKLTAAHRSLPIPSYVRVTNLDNQRTAIVRVNDRGPFHSERLIDLSYAAAVKLGFADRGTARVMVELVDGTDQLPNVASSNAPAAGRRRRRGRRWCCRNRRCPAWGRYFYRPVRSRMRRERKGCAPT